MLLSNSSAHREMVENGCSAPPKDTSVLCRKVHSSWSLLLIEGLHLLPLGSKLK